MAATTTLRVPDNLKQRIAKLAERNEKSPHTYMLDAIAEIADRDEARQDFHALADARLAKLAETGEVVDWKDMRPHLRERAKGKPGTTPKRMKLAR